MALWLFSHCSPVISSFSFFSFPKYMAGFVFWDFICYPMWSSPPSSFTKIWMVWTFLQVRKETMRQTIRQPFKLVHFKSVLLPSSFLHMSYAFILSQFFLSLSLSHQWCCCEWRRWSLCANVIRSIIRSINDKLYFIIQIGIGLDFILWIKKCEIRGLYLFSSSITILSSASLVGSFLVVPSHSHGGRSSHWHWLTWFYVVPLF